MSIIPFQQRLRNIAEIFIVIRFAYGRPVCHTSSFGSLNETFLLFGFGFQNNGDLITDFHAVLRHMTASGVNSNTSLLRPFKRLGKSRLRFPVRRKTADSFHLYHEQYPRFISVFLSLDEFLHMLEGTQRGGIRKQCRPLRFQCYPLNLQPHFHSFRFHIEIKTGIPVSTFRLYQLYRSQQAS